MSLSATQAHGDLPVVHHDEKKAQDAHKIYKAKNDGDADERMRQQRDALDWMKTLRPSFNEMIEVAWDLHGPNVEVSAQGHTATRIHVDETELWHAGSSADNCANVRGSVVFSKGTHVFRVSCLPADHDGKHDGTGPLCWAGVVDATTPKVDMSARRGGKFWTVGGYAGDLFIGDDPFEGHKHYSRFLPGLTDGWCPTIRVRVNMDIRSLAFSTDVGSPWIDAGVYLPEAVRPVGRLYGNVGDTISILSELCSDEDEILLGPDLEWIPPIPPPPPPPPKKGKKGKKGKKKK